MTILLCGTSGCGKSTLSSLLVIARFYVISTALVEYSVAGKVAIV